MRHDLDNDQLYHMIGKHNTAVYTFVCKTWEFLKEINNMFISQASL